MLNKITTLSVSIFLFLLPVFFLPFQNTPVDTDKQAVVIFFAIFFFILWLAKVSIDKKITFTRTTLDLPILLIAIVPLVSVFLFSPNKIQALTSPLSAGTLIAGAVIFFILSQISAERSSGNGKHMLDYLQPLLISSSIVSLYSFFATLRSSATYSPMGNYLNLFSFLLPLWVFIIANFIYASRSAKTFKITGKANILSLVTFIFITLGLGVSVFHLLSDQKPLLLPFPAGWSIMMQMYRDFTSFLFGIGPANFPYAYSIAKPQYLNLTPFWNIITNSSTSFFLTLATETGVICAIAFLMLALRSLNSFQHPKYHSASNPFVISLIITLLLLFALPGSVALLILAIVLLAIASPKLETKNYNLPGSVTYILVLAILGSLVLSYIYGKVYLADIFYRKTIVALNQKEPKIDDAFKFNQQAISFNPDSDMYHNLSSVLNLSVARNIIQSLQQDKQQDASASAEKQQSITKLSQQAVASAKRATELNPLNSQNWGQLSNSYQLMIGNVKDAERFTLDALDKQMQLDPVYPEPRLTAGNLMMAFGQKDQAKGLFMQAVNLKQDWNIAHYSLAQVYKQEKDYQNAYNEVQRTIDLTNPEAKEFKQLQQELEELKPLLPKDSTASADTKQGQGQVKVSPTPAKQQTGPKQSPPLPPSGTQSGINQPDQVGN